MSMKIAITGISGHIGNNIARALNKNGYTQINALVQNRESKSIEGIKANYILGDLFDGTSLDQISKDADVMIHLAAKISIGSSDIDLVYKTNIVGVKNVIEACKKNGIKKIIHFSSIHAHIASGPDIAIDEDTAYISSEDVPYDFSKSTGENLMLNARKEGIDVTIINPTAVIGPNDFKPSFSGKMMIDIYNGNMPSVVSGGFDWVDVRDIAEAVVTILEKNVFNQKFIMSGHYADLKDLANKICHVKGEKYKGMSSPIFLAKMGLPFISMFAKITGKPALYTSESLKAIEEGSLNNEHKNASKLLDYKPRPLDVTVNDTMLWFKNNSLL